MATGEETLVATLPAYLNALSERGSYSDVNDTCKRDAE